MATRTISPEANNYVRFILAVKGPCAECLRDVLQKFVPVRFQSINHALQSLEPKLKQHLESYKYSQLFTNHQLHANFSILECDMSLIYSLIRNSNWVPPPTRGWGKSVTNNPQDISLGANVERLHLFRNKFDHRNEPSILNQEFINYWTEMRKYVADIEKSLGSTQHQQSLDRLRGEDLDPEYANRTIKEFRDDLRVIQAEQCHQRDSLHDIQMSQAVHGSTLSGITNSLNEQSKDLLDLKIKESSQSNLLREVAVKSEQQYQLLQNDRKVLSDIKTSHAHQALSICEVLNTLRDDEKGLVHIVKEQNKKLEEIHETQTLHLNNNIESFKKIQEIMERRANEEASCTDSTDMRNQHRNEANNKAATTDALDCNVNRENDIKRLRQEQEQERLRQQYEAINKQLQEKDRQLQEKERRMQQQEEENRREMREAERLRKLYEERLRHQHEQEFERPTIIQQGARKGWKLGKEVAGPVGGAVTAAGGVINGFFGGIGRTLFKK